MEEQILARVIPKLQEALNIPVEWSNNTQIHDLGFDAMLLFNTGMAQLKFYAEVKREIRRTQLPHLLEQHSAHSNFIIIANQLFPTIRKELRDLQINYADSQGNVCIRDKNFYVHIESKAGNSMSSGTRETAFTKTGLMVIFCFLVNEDTLKMKYRELADQAGVSIGLLTKVIRSLINEGYLLKKDNTALKLTDKARLFEKWAEHYPVKLRPSLHLGNYRWDQNAFPQWKDLPLNPESTKWSGAVAADLISKALIPDTFIVYTKESVQDIMKTCRLFPDPNGTLSIYRNFWKSENPETYAPLPIVYADLIEHGTARYLEQAKVIHDKFINSQL